MPIQMKVSVDLDIDGMVAVVVDDRGGRSPPTIMDKTRLANAIASAISRIANGCEMYGLRREALQFLLPVELHMVLSWTCASETEALSVVEVIARAVCIKPTQIVAEYPPPDRAVEAIQHANAMVAEARRREEQWQGKYGDARMGAVAMESHMESTSEAMRKVIEEFGLEDTPLDEGYHTIDSRLDVLVEELRRMRSVIAARRASLSAC